MSNYSSNTFLRPLSQTDKNWDFLPEINNSFNTSETSATELFLFHNNFGLHYRESNFSLDLIRPVQPKSLNLNSNSQFLELLYTGSKDFQPLQLIQMPLINFLKM